MFQSSPALSSGRYIHGYTHPQAPTGFNPRPPFRAGATWRNHLRLVRFIGFNPRPPFRAGATRPGRADCLGHDVSILARPFERALRGGKNNRSVAAMFQSSPALSSGRYMEPCCVARLAEMFQSSPALSSGRYNAPPPASATRSVSILARPFERALHG